MRNGGGLEVLAMALGFGVSLALAASSHVSVAGFSPLLSFVFFSTAVIILLQYTRKDVVKFQESHDLGTFGPSHLRVLQANLVQLSSSLQVTLQNWVIILNSSSQAALTFLLVLHFVSYQMVIEKSMAPALEVQLHLYMVGCLPGDGILTCWK
jgi:hypothetical protein